LKTLQNSCIKRSLHNTLLERILKNSHYFLILLYLKYIGA